MSSPLLSPPRPKSRFRDAEVLIGLLLLVTAHTSWNGYRFGDSNLSIQIPLIKHYASPSLYVGDPLMETASRYTSFFLPAMGLFVRALDHLETTYFVLFVGSVLLGLYALWRISILIFEDPTSAALLMLLALAPVESLGAEIGHSSRFTHTTLAYSLLLWAFLFYLQGRESVAYAVTGLVFNIHALYAGYAFSMLAFDTLTRLSQVGVRSVLRRAMIFVLAALPALIWSFKSREPLNPFWVELLKTRSEHHSFPLAWEPHQYVRYLSLLALAAVGWGAGGRRDVDRTVLRFAAAVALLCVGAVVFTEYVPLKIAFQGQFFRSTRFLTAFALVYVARVLIESWERGVAGKTAATLSFLALFLPHLFGGALTVALLILLFSRLRELRLMPTLFAASILALSSFYPSPATPPQDTLRELAIALRELLLDEQVLLCSALFIVLKRASTSPAGKTLAGVVATGVVLFYSLPMENRSFQYRVHHSRWVEVQTWARENTPPTAVFLTPPLLAGFRVFSERPIVGEWKDGTQQYFSDSFTFEWWRRMRDLGAPDGSFEELGEERLLDIAGTYGAQYVVVPAPKKLRFSELYSNRAYTVYRFDSRGGSGGR